MLSVLVRYTSMEGGMHVTPIQFVEALARSNGLASLVGMILYYRPQLRGKLSPDLLKDAVLGEGYANEGTDAAWFVDYIAHHFGLKLSRVNGNAAALVAAAHACIAKGIAILFTEP